MQIDKNIISPNFDERPQDENGERTKIEFIIIHYTETDFDEAIDTYLDEKKKLSAHFLINKDGCIYNLVDAYKRAWHAGKSYWRGRKRLNDSSIGIELVNNGKENFTDRQMSSLVDLLRLLKKKFNINKKNILAHSDISPNRKTDPGIYFNWNLLIENDLVLGVPKYNLSPSENHILYKRNDDNISVLQDGLRRLGYNIQDTNVFDDSTGYAISSFRRRYLPSSISSNILCLENVYWDVECDLTLKFLLEEYKL